LCHPHRLYLRKKLRLHTAVKSNTSHPLWNEEFQLLVHDVAHQTLYLSMWDSDVFSSDDKIGAVELPLSSLDLTPGAVNDLWLTLGGPDGEVQPEGKPWFPWHRRADEREAGSDGRLGQPGRKRKWGWRRGKKAPQAKPSSSEQRVVAQPLAEPAMAAPPAAMPGGVVERAREGTVQEQQQHAALPSPSSWPGVAEPSMAAGLDGLGSSLRQGVGLPASSAAAAAASSCSNPTGRPGPELTCINTPVWDSPRQAYLDRLTGTTASSGLARGSEVLGRAGERGRQAIGQLGEQGQEALQHMVRTVAHALPQKKVCKLHIEVRPLLAASLTQAGLCALQLGQRACQRLPCTT
jgi:hypothetical protein